MGAGGAETWEVGGAKGGADVVAGGGAGGEAGGGAEGGAGGGAEPVWIRCSYNTTVQSWVNNRQLPVSTL